MHASRLRGIRWPLIALVFHPPTAIRYWTRELLLLGVFLSLAVWVTWPLAKHLQEAVPTSPNHAGTVPLLNVWTIWWNAESLSHGLVDYWDAPIFAPVPGAFALSEPQPIALAVAPLVWLTDSPTLAYNSLLLAYLVLNGWFAARLLRLLGCWPWTQLCGGAAMVLHPLALRHAEAIQLLSLWASLWTIMALISVHRQPNWRSGMHLGLAFATTAAACLHHALFLAIILLACGWLVIPPRRPWPTLCALLICGGVAALLLCGLVWPMHVIHGQHALSRDPEVVASLSATGASWLAWPHSGWLSGWLRPGWFIPGIIEAPVEFPAPLLPGVISTLLAAGGVVGWLGFGRRSSSVAKSAPLEKHGAAQDCAANPQASASVAVMLLIVIGLISCLLSFGPNLAWGGFRPWETLSRWIAPLSRVRAPYRFGYFTQMAGLLVAAWAADKLLRLGDPATRWSGRAWRQPLAVVGGLALLLLPLELTPPQFHLVYPPRVVPAVRSWTSVLASQPQTGAVLCLPTAAGFSEEAQEREARWMVAATLHGRPLLNGYSGFIPQSWQSLSFQLHRQGLTRTVLTEVQQRGARWIVLRSDLTAQATRLQEQLVEHGSGETPLVERIFDDGRYQVWRCLVADSVTTAN